MSSPSCSIPSAVHVCTPSAPSTRTPDKTVAVFQAKLQHALWLDKLTTMAHSEARSRARTRCTEAEERDALWWQHHREHERQKHMEDNVLRLEALRKGQTTSVWNVVPHCWADLLAREEASDRGAVEAAARDDLQMLYAAQHTWELRKSVRQLARQQWDAEAVQHAARHVRALELKLVARSYRAVSAFKPAADDLFEIAEGIHVLTAAPPSRAALPSLSLAVGHEAPCEAKIREMYDRRTLVYDEAKERLLLDWWQGAAQLRYVEAPKVGQLFALWGYYARSPVCIRALLTVQRWWRMQRVAPWSRHRQAFLAHSLRKLPGHHSAERYRRLLRSLRRTASYEKDGGTSTVNDVSAALVALVAAATSSRRYSTQLDIYTYTVVQEARAMLASRSAQDTAVAAAMQATRWPLCTYSRYSLPYDSWRHHRWTPYSEAHRLSVAAVERSEMSNWQCIKAEEAEHRHHAVGSSSSLPRGPLAVLEVQAWQIKLAQEERTSRVRASHQEAHEYNVLYAAVAAALPSPSQAASPLPLREVTNGKIKREAAATTAAILTSAAARPLGGHGATRSGGSAAASPSTDHDAWAQVQRCVQIAHEVLASAQQQSAQGHPERSGAAADKEMPAALSEDSAARYRAAFDEAAAAVYHDQYTAVRERYVARNAEALKQMRESFKAGLRERAIIIAEEAQELEKIRHGVTCAQRVSRFLLERNESHRRAAFERAHEKVAADLYEALSDNLRVSQWAVEARKLNEEACRAAARARQHPSFSLPSLSPADRLVSREAVRRTHLVCSCAVVLADVLLQYSRSYHELRYQDWAVLCRTDAAALDSAAPWNPPMAQVYMLKADEWDGRQAIWREAQVGARTLLVDGHALYGSGTVWSDYLFGHLKLTSEASYTDAQLRGCLLTRLANVGLKVGELIQMETMARGRVEYAESITRDLRFHRHRLRLE
nr:unnamed protein product [Leishmania braziliensis]